MAFNIDPSISLNVKGPQALTLPDMMNLATGIQDYKQKQAINPEIQKIYQQKANQGQLDLLNNHYENIAKNTQDLILDPDLSYDKIVDRAKQLNLNAGGNDQSLNQYLMGLPKTTNQKDLKAWLAQSLGKTLGAQAQIEKNNPAGILPGQQPSVSYSGDQNVSQTQTQNQPANSQTQTTQNKPQAGVSEDQMNKPVHSQPENTPYPVRNPNTPYLPFPTEKADQDEGFKVRNSLVQRQSTLTTDRRNLLEAKQAAKELEKEEWAGGAGIGGMAGRNLSTFLGTEMGIKYKQLSKDLANVQISNIQAKGGSLDTVAGQQLTKMANGDETYPPKVLLNIISRAQADMTELDKKANGAQKFAQKFGDNNMKKFQQEWQKNADSRVFELYNIFNDPEMTQAEKEKARDKILPKDAKQRKTFQEKWNNIQKLEQTGSL